MGPARSAIAFTIYLAAAATAAAGEPAGRDAGGEGGRLEIAFDANEKTYVPGPPPRVVLAGVVRVSSGGVRVEASGVVLTPGTGELYAEGPVRLVDAESRVELVCESLVYNLRTHRGRAERARLTLRPLSGAAGLYACPMSGPAASLAGPTSEAADEIGEAGRSAKPIMMSPADVEEHTHTARAQSRKARANMKKGRIERGEVSLVAVEAAEIVREGPGRFVADDVTVTSCGFARPHWRISARSVEIEPGAFLRVRGATLRLGRVPVFRLPAYTWDLSGEARPVGIDLLLGQSGRWGFHESLRLEFPVARNRAACDVDMWGFSLGHRSERGWEGGASLEWAGPGAEGRARLNAFFEDSTSVKDDRSRAEANAERRASKVEGDALPMSASRYLSLVRGEPLPDTSTLLRYADEPRHFAELAHRSDLGAGWEAEARVFAASDRDVRQEYLEKEAKTGLPDFSYVDLRRRTPGSLLSVYTGFRTADFRTETEYLPELRWTAPACVLGGGVLLGAEASTGFLRERYDALVAGQGYDSFRARTRLLVMRPFRLGPLSFSPYVGTDQAYYDRSTLPGPTDDEDRFFQGAGLYGGSISTRVFGNLRAGERPLRHVIEARAEYVGVSATTRDPAEVPGFDRTDDLMETNRLRLSLDQRWQTKLRDAKGVSRTHELAGLLLGAELFARSEESDLLNGGRDWAPVRAALFLRPSPGFRVHSALEWEKETSATLASQSGVEFSGESGPSGHPETASWRVGLFLVESRTPGADASREIAFRLGLAPAGRWALDFRGRYELEDSAPGGPGWADTRLGLVRDFHDWDLRLSVWHDPAKGDSGVSVSVAPKGYPVNLPPPAR